MLQKLRTVIYHVADLPAAKEWYIKATGIQPYFDEPFYVGFDINGISKNYYFFMASPSIPLL